MTKPIREGQYVRVARLAYPISQKALPKYSHAKSPHRYTLPQLAACVMVGMYLKLSYRQMEEALHAMGEVRTVLGLAEVPDHVTLARTFAKLRVADLDKLNMALLEVAGVADEEVVAVDTTSFRLAQASAYYMTRTGRTYRDWGKADYAVGLRSKFILGWRAGRGSACGSDIYYLNPLRRQASRYTRQQRWVILADAGFDGTLTRVGDLIPVNRRNHDLKSPDRNARADCVCAARLEGLYGQRWFIETVNSVIKRITGDTVRSGCARLRHRKVLLKGLLYNLHI